MKTLVTTISVLASLNCCCLSAQEIDAASFVKSGVYSSGSANISSPQGGMYIYTPPTPDSRIKTPPFSIGRAKRQTYQLFSAQEEEALWLMREENSQASDDGIETEVQKPKGHPKLAKYSLDWPKVVVRGSDICVPVLDHSDSKDWQQYLTCWSPDAANVN